MNKKSLNALTIILNLFFILGCLISFFTLIAIIINFNPSNILEYLVPLVDLILTIVITIIVYKLKLIVENIENGDCFNIKNNHYFRHIGLLSLILSIFYIIITYPIPYQGNLQVISTKYGSLKIGSFVFLIFGSLAYVLSGIFKLAFLTKEENDLTI
ncbi:DUF2975 domain-containing protein [Clostridium sp. Marseille-QA1073]